MRKLIIFPFNGNGLEALDCIGGQFEFIGFADDTTEKQGKNNHGFSVYSRDIIDRYPEAFVLAVPGGPNSFTARKKVIDSLKLSDNRFATIIHPLAHVSGFAEIGLNSVIMAGVVITSNAVIGKHVCILPNTVVHHDSFIGNYCLIGSNVTVAGNTSIGTNCYIGSGVSIINNIEIGEFSLIGIGSNVIKSLPAGVTAAGNPSRILS